jgi:protein mago nashi
MIRTEVYINEIVIDEMKRIISAANINELSDKDWPIPDREGRQEVEIFSNGKSLLFVTSKIRSMNDVASSKDPQGLQKLYYLVQDIKCLVFSLINLHFRVKPV